MELVSIPYERESTCEQLTITVSTPKETNDVSIPYERESTCEPSGHSPKP